MMAWIGFLIFGSVLMFFAWRQSSTEAGLSKLEKVIYGETVPEIPSEKKKYGVFVQLSRRFMGIQLQEDIKQKLQHAGMAGKYTAEEFFALKVTCVAVAFGVFSALAVVGSGVKGLVFGLLFSALGFIGPDVWLNSKAEQRKAEIEKGLLQFIDMLAVSCEAGLSLPQAVQRVASYDPGLLASEFSRAFKESELGRPRREALKDMAKRNGVPELNDLVSALIEADEHGTPVAQVLHSVAGELRRKRRNKGQETAQKAAVKMLFPVIFFMFIPMMIIMIGPALVNMLRDLGL